jgi:CCR4-NOT transcription complex subunit 6
VYCLTPGHFKLLTQLRIFKNRLRSLPPQIGDLSALQILWLQDNLLTTLPPEIEKLSNLTLLSLKGNPLKVPWLVLILACVRASSLLARLHTLR